MSTILDAVVPLFAVIFAGFIAGRMRMISEEHVRGLNNFVFTFAMPVMLFKLMASTNVLEVGEWRFVAGFLYGELLVFLAGGIVGAVIFRQRFTEMTMQGFGSTFCNGVLIGLPLLIGLFGEKGAIPAALLFTLDVVIFSVITVLLEMGRSDKPAMRSSPLITVSLAMLRNPILMSTLIGICWGILEWPIPSLISNTFGFLGQAGPPAALFALGATLAYRRIAGSIGSASFMVLFKLLLHPLAAFLILTYLVPVGPFWVYTAVIFAACPVGANVYVFAQQYQVSVTTASTAILVSTGLSLMTITALLLMFPPIAL